MTKNTALNLLSKYVETLKDIPVDRYKMKKYEYLNNCYIRWALDEIEQYLLVHDKCALGTDAFVILNDFSVKMMDFSCQANTEEASFIFATASDVIEDFIGFCIMEEGGF